MYDRFCGCVYARSVCFGMIAPCYVQSEVNNASVLISAHRASLKTPPRGVLPSRRSGRIRSNTPTAATSLLGPRVVTHLTEALDLHKETGRVWCRERVCQYV